MQTLCNFCSFSQERQKYYKHAQKAKYSTGRYLSIILDGRDQDKTSPLHYMKDAKGLSNLWKMKVNLMGPLSMDSAYGFVDTFQWAHGSSCAISVKNNKI
ncbi:hypothetical protein DPMN_082394 [Dreissena polymorpha]|uniref:Uncharacterized protein n=1 Tax=Dreissena polymorpha TaxID=45954 RepID=A0A9D3Y6V5_DREPO|nr:hypothetical protein DPMN_082394 [Dreissena polymorpha]